jgi:hypothetical protein
MQSSTYGISKAPWLGLELILMETQFLPLENKYSLSANIDVCQVKVLKNSRT